MLKTKFAFAIAFFWTIFVATLSLISIGDVGQEITIPNKDKYVHFLFYFIFVSLWYLYLNKKKPTSKNRIVVLFGAIGFGVLMEICQGLFTVTRTPDVLDAFANSVGAIFGLLFITTILKTKN